MPDSYDSRRSGDTPADWAQAFAAMPLETAPADGWSRMSAALDRREGRGQRSRRDRRTSWLIGMAGAAVLAVVAWAPLQRMADAGGGSKAVAASPTRERTITAPIVTPPAQAQTASPDSVAATARQDTNPGTLDVRAQPPRIATLHSMPDSQQTLADRDASRRATNRLIATLPIPAPPSIATAQNPDAIATDATDSARAIAQLQAQASQLEALVAIARDERFGSATTVAITTALESDIARIDTDLARLDLDAAQRTQLWEQRVEVLQQLAGVETTQRWFAAQGEHYDDAMVSVY